MSPVNKCVVIGIFLIATSGYAKDWYSAQSEASVNLKATEDLTLGVRGFLHWGQQIVQADDYFLRYQHSGLTAREVAAGFGVAIGEIGKVAVSGGGEIYLRGRKTDTTFSKDYRELTPAAFVNFCLPLVKGAKVEFNNRFERRNFRAPEAAVTELRYNPGVRLTSIEFTPLKISGFGYYEGFNQKYSAHMSGWGTGITLFPLDLFKIECAFTTLWFPSRANTVVHQVELNLQYTIDVAR